MCDIKSRTRNPQPAARPRGQAGFTLAELLIAIFIMAIGVTMAGSIFPAAVKRASSAMTEVIGTMIAKDGLAVAQSKLVYSNSGGVKLNNTVVSNPDKLADYTTYIGAQDVQCPTASGTARCFVVVGRQATTGINDFQLAVVACTKSAPGNTAAAVSLGKQVNSGDTTVDLSSVTGGNYYRLIGSPVIGVDTANNLRYAYIVSANGSKGTLNHPLGGTCNSDQTMVIVEKNGGGNIQGNRSPAMEVVATRTALTQY